MVAEFRLGYSVRMDVVIVLLALTRRPVAVVPVVLVHIVALRPVGERVVLAEEARALVAVLPCVLLRMVQRLAQHMGSSLDV